MLVLGLVLEAQQCFGCRPPHPGVCRELLLVGACTTSKEPLEGSAENESALSLFPEGKLGPAPA